jgi:hypothetical protein
VLASTVRGAGKPPSYSLNLMAKLSVGAAYDVALTAPPPRPRTPDRLWSVLAPPDSQLHVVFSSNTYSVCKAYTRRWAGRLQPVNW